MRMLVSSYLLAALSLAAIAETNAPPVSPRAFLMSLEPKRKEFNTAVTRFAYDKSRWPTNATELKSFATTQKLPLGLSIYSTTDFKLQTNGSLRVVFGYSQFSQKEVRQFRIGTEKVNIHADPHTRDVQIEKTERRDSVSPKELSNKPPAPVPLKAAQSAASSVR